MAYQPLFGDYADSYASAPYLDFTEEVADSLPGIWSSSGLQPTSLADFGCGNGIMLARLAPLLTRAVAVDSSPQMLKHTKAVLAEVSLPVDIVEADVREYVVPDPVEIVTCIYNTVNYLTTDGDVALLFANAHRSLVDDGMFIFDAHPHWYISQEWRDGTFVEIDTDDTFEVWQNPYDEDTGIVSTTVTLMTKRADGSWSRLRETHPSRGLDAEKVVPMLERAGFSDIAVHGGLDLRPADDTTERLWFTARKN